MKPTRIKICGITNLEDALAAVEAGADVLGYNFYPHSPRYISPVMCARIQAGLENHGISVCTVGVFVNETVGSVSRTLKTCGLDLAQLSGDEPPLEVKALGGLAFKGIRPQNEGEAVAFSRLYAEPEVLPALLVDAYRPGLYGGTGHTGNWSLARSLSGRYSILLAGGLHPGNVAQAVEQVRPWGVDVASGVESSPRRKDPQKMSDFIQAVQKLSQEVSPC